jgi:hypothetical protein
MYIFDTAGTFKTTPLTLFRVHLSLQKLSFFCMYFLISSYFLHTYIHIPGSAVWFAFEYGNFIDKFNADLIIQTHIILITRTCKPNHFSFWCDNNHYHQYSAGFLETLFVKLLMPLEQLDFVNLHL